MDEQELMIPEHEPTDEEIAEWERERAEREAAKIAPFKAIAEANRDRDDLLADVLEELTVLEIGGE